MAREFVVTGMTCGHCEAAVRQEVSTIPGLEVLEVSAADGRLVVRSVEAGEDSADGSAGGGTIDDAAVLAAVEEAGYRATRA